VSAVVVTAWLGGIAGVITAVTALVVALRGNSKAKGAQSSADLAQAALDAHLADEAGRAQPRKGQ
jgi:hypothetical protein